MEHVPADKIQKSLQQKENISIHLQHLINQAEEFDAKNSNYDVIKEYLLLSGNCQELLQLIKEVSSWDSQGAILLFKALSFILIRTAKDLDIYSGVGTSIANEIISYGMRTVLSFLKTVRQKSSRIKSALHLLTSMVALGGQIAHQVVAKLNFANTELFHLLGKTNLSEDEDVRTAFLNLIILIVTICNKNVIRKMVEIKGFFNLILHGLLSDRVSTIILVLDILRVYVIEDLNIPKTLKLNLFNDRSLKPATQLYLWKGPLKRNNHGKRKLGKKECYTVAYEISDEEVAEVRSCVHKFLLALLCSHKHGIMFSDPTCGVKGRNNNPVITKVLEFVPIPYCDPLVSDLVISVFQASPDQLKFYFPMFKDNFIPRLSLSWLKAIDFLKKVIKSLNPVSVLFKTDIKRTIPVLINIAKIFCLLDVVTPSDMSEVFLNGHRILCYHMCSFMLSILNQVKIIIDFCDFEFSNFLYDPSEMSDFKKSFLSLIFPSLPAMDKIHHYWNRVTSEAIEIVEDEFLKDLPIPKLSEELFPLIEVMKLYKIFSCKLSREFDLDVPLLLNNLKKCSTVLSPSDQSKICLSVIDIFSEQYNVTPWSKQKINNSPIIMILEVYLAAHKSGELVGARNILHKILLNTKIFDDCLWEIDLWLDAVECAESQDIPVIFVVLNEAIYSVLNQSTKIISEDEECIEKSNIKKTVDSSDSETTCKESPNKKKLFNKFVFAVLEKLKFLEKSKRKGCQIFVEKTLDPLMHYQHSAKFFAALEPYKSVINPAIYDYWKFLFFYSSNIEICIDEVCTGNTSCNLDLIDHLRQNFISYHSSAVEISLCDISNLIGCLSKNSVRKVIWQLLMYIDFEAKLILRNESQTSSMIILDIKFLEEILTFFPLFKNKPNCNLNEDVRTKQYNISSEEIDIVKDLLKHPILLKLFLFGMNALENSVECIKNITVAITKFVLNIVKKISSFSNESLYLYLTPFKQKILKFVRKAKMYAFTEDLELSYIIGTFVLFFEFNDIQIILQTVLDVENNIFQNLDAYFPTLCLLLQIFIEKKEFVLLSSTCINALISVFASLPKKRKKILGQYIYQLLLQHPIHAFLFTEDSMMLLLQHSSIKDLNILGVLIDYSYKFRQITQTFISDSLEEANTVKCLYLSSKCLCNAEKENKSETEFKDLIFSRFFDTFKEIVFNDLTNDLDILHNCSIGKSIQIFLQDKKENSKILRNFCKSLMKNHSDEVPSVSKMHAILQLFHSWKLCSSDNNKTRLCILKVCFLWLSTGLSADFKNLELTNFIKEMIENMDCLKIDEVIDVTNFFQKSLKFALKSDDIGKDILKILCLLCEKSKGNNLPVQCIHDLVCGHSCFFKIMLTEEKEKNILKEHLIDLLTVLTKLDGSVCKENHLGFILSAYGASMSINDQKLLYLLKLYADNKIDMNEYSPFLWGKSAISHYSVMKASERFLWKKPSLQDILSLFVPEKIETTLLYFPLTMKLEPCTELFEMDSHLANKIYDMRFILPLFAHLLSPGTLVYCTQFIQSKVLMLIFISLSSLETSVRALGFYCLALFYQHLELARFKEKTIWLCLLDFLRNSIESSNSKIPNIVSLFLARVADIFSKPDHQMYRFLYSFITRKPFLDIRQVPEFYNLFNGTSVEHRMHREWLLKLLTDGLRTSLDFHICEKRHVFNSLFIHYASCLSITQEKVAILGALNSAVKIKSVACTLYEHALLTWISNAIEESNLSDMEVLKNLCAVVENLEENIPDHFYFTTILWKLIPKVKFLDVCTIKSLILTLLKSLSVMKNSNSSVWSKYRISGENMNQLCEIWKSLIKKLETEKTEHMEDEISFDALKINECLLIFAKISIFWEPILKDVPEVLYKKQLNSLCSVLELIFQINSYSPFYFSDLPIWLHKCAKTDSKHGLVKVLLSSEGIKSLTSIIELFEKSFNQEYKDEKYQQPKRNNWTEFLLYVKEISTKWHFNTKSPILQQIWNAI